MQMYTKVPLLRSQNACGGPLACTVAACMIGAKLVTAPIELEIIDEQLQKACRIWPYQEMLSVPETLAKLPFSLRILEEQLCFLRHDTPSELGGTDLGTVLLRWRDQTSFCVLTNNQYSFTIGHRGGYFHLVDTHNPAPCLLRTLFPIDICIYIEQSSARNPSLLAKQADLYILTASQPSS